MLNENKIEEKILDKKINSYSFHNYNITIPQEIMVTITLNEYRNLVEKDAATEYKLSIKNTEIYELENKLKKLKEQTDMLKEKLCFQSNENKEEENTLEED